jgi:hydroxymethylpyrimidine kinase/phosphomethylpyrimidine kinase/thiamine-phosphate diphosphorylase
MNPFAGVQVHVDPDGGLRCWLDTGHARGWLTPAAGVRSVGTPDLFSRHFEAAIAKGFVAADAAVLAMMASCHPDQLPLLSWGEHLPVALAPSVAARPLDLYAIVDSAERVRQVLAAGVKTLQLRIKTPEQPDPQWLALLRGEVRRSVAACEAAGAELFINDHWQLAAEEGAHGVHLGQEDLLALGDAGRAALQATGMSLGISSHSLWELCRARTLAPRYIACGPVWPTLTKAMPWLPQGLDNLAWWCRMAQAPVVAIGGILGAEQVFESARCGADGVCIVRGLGERPEAVVARLQAALETGRKAFAADAIPMAGPHPSLVGDAGPTGR